MQSGASGCCYNFYYDFKGAPCAPRLAACNRARDLGGKLEHAAESGGLPPRRSATPHDGRSPKRDSTRAPTAWATAPGGSPHQLSAATCRACANSGHPPSAAIVEADQDHSQTVCNLGSDRNTQVTKRTYTQATSTLFSLACPRYEKTAHDRRLRSERVTTPYSHDAPDGGWAQLERSYS